MEGKIYVPTRLRKQILTWYHEFLVHPGQKRLELTVRQEKFSMLGPFFVIVRPR